MSHIAKINFSGDPNIGLFGFATDKYCLLGVESKKIFRKVSDVLKVPVFHSSFLRTELLGIFSTGSSNGIIIPGIADDDEVEGIKKTSEKIFGDERVMLLDTNFALGNMILMNDNGIILSSLLRKHGSAMERFFGIPCKISTIARLGVVGSLALATNKGCLVHPRASKQEIEMLEKTLGVPVDVGTVGFGSPFPGAGVIANSHGFVAAKESSGYELGRIDEALGFL